MNWHKVSLTLRGSTATPWQADTLFGHLCWVLRHQRGEAALRDFLVPFMEGKPPFLVSDGFPGDLLPRPLALATPQGEGRQAFREARKLRKRELLSQEDFRRALQGEAFVPQELKEDSGLPVPRVTLKNQISRLTGTTPAEGGLFPFTEYWMPQVTIYLKIEPGFEEQARELFLGLARSGYGKRKSVGYGAIDSLSFLPFSGFPVPQGANAFVSLSSFTPGPGDPTQGRWRTRVKFGRLGEEFALSENPFKRPLLMFTAGSVLFDSPPGEHYGRMVTGLSREHPEVVHYCYALPVPMVVKENRR